MGELWLVRNTFFLFLNSSKSFKQVSKKSCGKSLVNTLQMLWVVALVKYCNSLPSGHQGPVWWSERPNPTLGSWKHFPASPVWLPEDAPEMAFVKEWWLFFPTLSANVARNWDNKPFYFAVPNFETPQILHLRSMIRSERLSPTLPALPVLIWQGLIAHFWVTLVLRSEQIHFPKKNRGECDAQSTTWLAFLPGTMDFQFAPISLDIWLGSTLIQSDLFTQMSQLIWVQCM